MKKIGIVTFYSDNYGAFLQAYAFEKLLHECGYSPKLINYDYDFFGPSSADQIRSFKFRVKKAIANLLHLRYNKAKKKIFQKAIKEHLEVDEKIIKCNKDLEALNDRFDAFISGSDQVFNSNIYPNSFDFRLLRFSSKPKYSYAASRGKTASFSQKLADNLLTFDKVSFREKSFMDDYTSKTGLSGDVHFDPSLLLTAEQWRFFSKPAFKNVDYIFYYRVGYDQRLYDAVSLFSKERNIPVLVVNGHETFENMICKGHILSPSEWVSAIANSKYVFTNSFHGTAFSMIFHKKCHIIVSSNSDERISNIVSKAKLEPLQHLSNIDNINDDSFDKFEALIKEEKKHTIEYLSNI